MIINFGAQLKTGKKSIMQQYCAKVINLFVTTLPLASYIALLQAMISLGHSFCSEGSGEELLSRSKFHKHTSSAASRVASTYVLKRFG